MLIYENQSKNIKNLFFEKLKRLLSAIFKKRKKKVDPQIKPFEDFVPPKTNQIVIIQFEIMGYGDKKIDVNFDKESDVETKDNYTLFKEYIEKNSNDGVLPSNKDIESDLNISDSTIKRMKNKAVENGFIEKISDRKYILKIQ